MYSLLERQPCWFLMLNKTETHTQKHRERERERFMMPTYRCLVMRWTIVWPNIKGRAPLGWHAF